MRQDTSGGVKKAHGEVVSPKRQTGDIDCQIKGKFVFGRGNLGGDRLLQGIRPRGRQLASEATQCRLIAARGRLGLPNRPAASKLGEGGLGEGSCVCWGGKK